MKVQTKSIRIPERLHATIKLAAFMRAKKLEAFTAELIQAGLAKLKIRVAPDGE